jgi:hypothetical protein
VPDTDPSRYAKSSIEPPEPTPSSSAQRSGSPETVRRLLAQARNLASANPSETRRHTDALAELISAEFCAGRECALRGALAQLGEPIGTGQAQPKAQSDPRRDRQALDLLLSVADDFACRAQCPSCQADERRRPMRSVYAFPMAISGPFHYRINDEARLELTQTLTDALTPSLTTSLPRESIGHQPKLLVLPGLVPARTLTGLRWLPMLHLIQAVADGVNVLEQIAGAGSEPSPNAGPWQLRFLMMVLEQTAQTSSLGASDPTLEQLRSRLEPILRRHLRVPVELLDIPRIAFVSLQSGVICWLVRNLAERRDRLIAAGRKADELQARTATTLSSRGGLRVEILDDDGITLADTEFPTDGIEQPQELIALMGSGLRSLGFRLAQQATTHSG